MADNTAHSDLIKMGTRRAPVTLTKAVRERVVIAHGSDFSYLQSIGIDPNSSSPDIDLDSVRAIAADWWSRDGLKRLEDDPHLDYVNDWLIAHNDRVLPPDLIAHLEQGPHPEDLAQPYDTRKLGYIVWVSFLTALFLRDAESAASLARAQRIMAAYGKAGEGTLLNEDDVYFLLTRGVLTIPSLPGWEPRRALARKAAIGEMTVVRESVIGYRLGELAHIENAPARQSFLRRHQVTRLSEQEALDASETEESSERDTQTEDRTSLAHEAERSMAEEVDISASLSFSASGIGWETTATGDFAYHRNSDESSRTASEVAHSVIDRTITRTRQRTLTSRRDLRRVQVVETTRHEIDNSGSDKPVVGVYRWVDKVYKVEVVMTGLRMLCEFLVPDPASFLRHLNLESVNDEPLKPEKPEIKPENIDRENWAEKAAEYHAAIPAPPPEKLTVGKALSKAPDKFHKVDDKKPETAIAVPVYAGDASIQIPDGYLAAEFKINVNADGPDRKKLIIAWSVAGVANFKGADEWSIQESGDINPDVILNGMVPITLYIGGSSGYAADIEVTCTLSPTAFQQWQLEAYESIWQAYQQRLADWEMQRSASRNPPLGFVGAGHPPAANRENERVELRRNVIAMLRNNHFTGNATLIDMTEVTVPSAPADQEKLEYPELNFAAAEAIRDEAAWFEQAFEWGSMSFLTYPYYWADKHVWPELRSVSDPADPLHTRFLGAGAARVLLPVRPGFEAAMELYLASGIMWSGLGAPTVGGNLFVPLVTELAEQQGRLKGKTIDTWTYQLPTELVVLGNAKELFSIDPSKVGKQDQTDAYEDDGGQGGDYQI